ncbi:MAG: hypothetical protein ACJ0QJ_01275 [Flavobacteriales bacterium]
MKTKNSIYPKKYIILFVIGAILLFSGVIVMVLGSNKNSGKGIFLTILGIILFGGYGSGLYHYRKLAKKYANNKEK